MKPEETLKLINIALDVLWWPLFVLVFVALFWGVRAVGKAVIDSLINCEEDDE